MQPPFFFFFFSLCLGLLGQLSLGVSDLCELLLGLAAGAQAARAGGSGVPSAAELPALQGPWWHGHGTLGASTAGSAVAVRWLCHAGNAWPTVPVMQPPGMNSWQPRGAAEEGREHSGALCALRHPGGDAAAPEAAAGPSVA